MRARTLPIALTFLLTAAMALTACGDSDDADRGTSGSGGQDRAKVYTEADTEITVANGDTFVVALPVTSGTGYSWTAVVNPDLHQLASEQVQQAKRPGAPATQRITFRARATGSTTLVLNYAQPFNPGVVPAQTATFDVTVTG